MANNYLLAWKLPGNFGRYCDRSYELNTGRNIRWFRN